MCRNKGLLHRIIHQDSDRPLHPDEQPTLTEDELVDMLERDAEHS